MLLFFVLWGEMGAVKWVLTPEASRQDLSDFDEISFLRRDALYKRYVENIFQVSFFANRQLYDQMTREDRKMCKAFKDLLKEDFVEAEARGKVIGEAQGEIKGVIKRYHEEIHSENIGIFDSELIDNVSEK